ncbi:flagellar basal body-associated FliL family protein [Rhizobium sp. C1]|uniref:flagellar basal body-associated FliL family protein n=1 Tax=Rhizobium sp. C1 TaxID=1349799 RepID=UPI001E4B964D|nr:flagellar basal body-associated FliL family protein [Rhizobium sp. C1]MCD2179022.1 flagellar basal body-associated FliL family protein [Rhizobium sp. C1]
MADAEAAPEGEGEEGGKKKGGGLVVTIVIVLVLSLVAAGGGWFLGKSISGKFITQEKKDEIAKKAAEQTAIAAAEAGGEKKGGGKKEEDSVPKLATEENNVVQLEPITSNLAYPSESWVRLEVALLFGDKPDEKTAEEVHQDIMAYLRTVSLQQIQTARGFEYLRQDIKERATLRTEGRVKDVMFRTFVVQ